MKCIILVAFLAFALASPTGLLTVIKEQGSLFVVNVNNYTNAIIEQSNGQFYLDTVLVWVYRNLTEVTTALSADIGSDTLNAVQLETSLDNAVQSLVKEANKLVSYAQNYEVPGVVTILGQDGLLLAAKSSDNLKAALKT